MRSRLRERPVCFVVVRDRRGVRRGLLLVLVLVLVLLLGIKYNIGFGAPGVLVAVEFLVFRF